VTTALVALLAAQPLHAADSVRLAIYPRFQNAPATVRVTLIIERDAANRQACIDIEGDTGYSRSSCWEHIGEGARYQTVIYYPDLPAGRYTAVAEVTRADHSTARSRLEEFRLLGIGDTPDPEP
jgi:hypothetical protein